MVNFRIHWWEKGMRTKHVALLWLGALTGAAQAETGAAANLAKALAPFEGLLLKGLIGLLGFFVALVVWEVVEQKRASRSSLDIAKLAAAAAKKKSSAAAPASGSLTSVEAPSSRSFAPPPPPPPPPAAASTPPPSGGSAPPPPPPPADNPFASSGAGAAAVGGAQPADSTVAFTPPDAGSSGGWADLLQRVRAGEPEAASFGDSSPPPSTEQEPNPGFAPPAGGTPSETPTAGAFQMPPSSGSSGEFSPPPGASLGGGAPSSPQNAPDGSASSEAWEALLKRTTGGPGDSPFDAPPTQDSGRISLGSAFSETGIPASPDPTSKLGGGPPSFSLPGSQQPEPGPGDSPGFKIPGTAGTDAPTSAFQLPGSGGSDAPTLAFQLPGSGGSDAPTSAFSLPGSQPPPSGEGPPSFKLPGGQESKPAAGAGGAPGFSMPGGGGANPFDSSGFDDPSSTLPLTDMFGSGQAGSPPSFQLPSMGQQKQGGGGDFGGGFQFDGEAGRTISLDFSQGSGQTPPPPQPKTEG